MYIYIYTIYIYIYIHNVYIYIYIQYLYIYIFTFICVYIFTFILYTYIANIYIYILYIISSSLISVFDHRSGTTSAGRAIRGFKKPPKADRSSEFQCSQMEIEGVHLVFRKPLGGFLK